ncbi:MAG: helix-turn-helix transcriptional regulator [Victivallaceae bacterium]
MYQPELDIFAVEKFTNLGKRLEALRKSRNLSQMRLAIKSGVSKNSISAYECNKRNPRYESIMKLASSLDVTCGTLAEVNEFYDTAPAVLRNYDPETGRFFLYREK